MESDSLRSTGRKSPLRKLLYAWPLTLAGLTFVLLLVAGRVSAWHGGAEDPSEAWRHHAERVLDRILADLEATDEQASAIRSIVEAATNELRDAHAARASDADSWRSLATADTIDRGALEALRVAHLGDADALSAIASRALADVLDVLTTEQRRQLVAGIDEHHAHHGHHARHGRHGGHGMHDRHGFGAGLRPHFPWHTRSDRHAAPPDRGTESRTPHEG